MITSTDSNTRCNDDAAVASRSAMTVVIREDRLSDFAGVRLVLASLWRRSPESAVKVYLTAEHTARFQAELLELHPLAQFVEYSGASSWACKPSVLLDALTRVGSEERVVWLDTDIVVLRSLTALAQCEPDRMYVAEESNPNPNELLHRRQELLGIETGSARETTISSAVVGVTSRHRAVLEMWEAKVNSAPFLHQQTLTPRKRLLFGDQEVLEAVVCGRNFADLPVTILRNWQDLLQATYTSFGPARPSGQCAAPLLIHATGNLKPWRRSRLRTAQELFPYFDEAQPYLSVLPVEDRLAFRGRSLFARAFKTLATFEDYARLRRWLNGLRDRMPV